MFELKNWIKHTVNIAKCHLTADARFFRSFVVCCVYVSHNKSYFRRSLFFVCENFTALLTPFNQMNNTFAFVFLCRTHFIQIQWSAEKKVDINDVILFSDRLYQLLCYSRCILDWLNSINCDAASFDRFNHFLAMDSLFRFFITWDSIHHIHFLRDRLFNRSRVIYFPHQLDTFRFLDCCGSKTKECIQERNKLNSIHTELVSKRILMPSPVYKNRGM